MGGFFADVFGVEEEIEDDVIQAEQDEEAEAEESEEQRDAEQRRSLQCFLRRLAQHGEQHQKREVPEPCEVTLWQAEESRSWTKTA